VHVSPAAGAGFTQYTAEVAPGGSLGTAAAQRFFYLLEGTADLATDTSFRTLTAGSYGYFPEGHTHTITAQEQARIAVIEKPYHVLASKHAPTSFVGHERDVAPVPLMGDPDLEVRSLVADSSAYDFAVNTMTFQPGASLSLVEMHVMEHGLLMLEGGGIYRLGDNWYPVQAGDFIWMKAFCPQWFGAIGKRPAKYLIYKDWNRHPLG
jgi:(S)-ureidoglycine aminohydrolase